MKGLTLRGRIWWITYNANGRRYRESVSPNRAEAVKALRERRRDILTGKFYGNRKAQEITFRALADKYWELHGPDLRSTAWRYMMIKVVTELGEKFGDIPAGNIPAVDLQIYYNEIRARSSISTANRYLTLIKAVYNNGLHKEIYHGPNPAAKVSKGKEPPNRTRYLTHGEIRVLLGSCDARIFPLLACAIYTGMRRGEMLALTWANIDLAGGLIYILQSKSGKPREIPIAPNLRDILAGIGPQGPAAKVFDMPIITLRRLFDKALRATGIMGFHFHDLRHTFASHFIMKTGNLPALQKILGHASPIMTQRYAHLSHSYLKAEMLAFNDSIPPAEAPETSDRKQIGHNLGTIATAGLP
ncbi:MAG: integrase family protein [Elusimicrobia bacterium]|nr:MAG: integrase family protein [Elusimicrobiota bacterium]KAF0154957.1 MAG: integrase family protein [Elusimicrobiota bacterium]